MARPQKVRKRHKRNEIRKRQAAAIPQWIDVEYKPEVTRSRRTLAMGSKAKMPKPTPLSQVVPNLEDVILKTALAAAHYDLDIFREGPITFRVKTYRKHLCGDAHPTRVIQLYIYDGLPESELIDSIAHELRHIGHFARGESSRFKPGSKGYNSDPIEIDARGFAAMICEVMNDSKRNP